MPRAMASDTGEPTTIVQTEEALLAGVLAIVSTLREVDGGDLSRSVELPYPESEPVGALAASVNILMRSLGERREETLAFQRELEAQIATIEQQRAAIRELSTPVLQVWTGVLCAPIVGALDSTRAAEMSSALLEAVVRTDAAYVIIDITGIEAMDTHAADHFLRMGKTVRLLGAECVLSGISPAVARTITHMGMALDGIESYRSLRDALRHYVEALRSLRSKPR